MSVNLKKQGQFISILLDADLPLVQNVLSNASAPQLSALAEIFYNIKNLPLSNEVYQKLTKYRPIFKRYVNNSSTRRRLARKHFKIFKKTLDIIGHYIIELLK